MNQNTIDFWNEINKDETSKNENENEYDNDKDKCLISFQPLSLNYIKLICGHCFNYKDLINDIKTFKSNSHNIIKLSKTQFCCPYCRQIINGLLPTLPGYKSLPGITSKSKHVIPHRECDYINRKKCKCNKKAFDWDLGTYCNTHYNIEKTKQIKKTWTSPIMQQMYKDYTITELRKLIETKNKLHNINIPIQGSKYMLIHSYVNTGLG